MAGTFEDFFSEHYDAVLAGVRAVGASEVAATDATQEAFVRAYPRWWRIKHYRSPAAWVQRVAINVGRDLERTQQRQGQVLAQVQVSCPTDASSLFDSSEGAVAALPSQQEAVVRAYYSQGMSTAETADLMGISPGAVRFHLSQARSSLRSTLTNNSAISGQEA